MENYTRQVMPGENKVEALANMIHEIEDEQQIKISFEGIKTIAKKNNFNEDEIAELIVMYF